MIETAPGARPLAAARGSARALRVALVVAALVVVVAAQRFGLLGHFADPSRAKQALLALGPWGYAVFVATYALFQPFGVPGTVFILVAPLVWPWPTAFAVSMAGTMAASVVGFSFARFVARDWIAARIPARLRRYDEAIAKRAFATVFVLRFVLWMPPLLHAFFGVSKVGFWTHFFASLAGYVLPLLVVSYAGERVYDAIGEAPPAMWIGLGVVTVAVVFIARMMKRRGGDAGAEA